MLDDTIIQCNNGGAIQQFDDVEQCGFGGSACRGLVKRYADVVAVNGLDLDVHRGECFGLLGPNGAGKTTSIEIIEGLLAADAGDVEVLGARWETAAHGTAAAHRHPVAGNAARRQAHRRGNPAAVPIVLSRGRRSGRPDRDGRAGSQARHLGREVDVADSASGCPSPVRSLDAPICCFSTSPRPASIRSHDGNCGRCWNGFVPPAARCC